MTVAEPLTPELHSSHENSFAYVFHAPVSSFGICVNVGPSKLRIFAPTNRHDQRRPTVPVPRTPKRICHS